MKIFDIINFIIFIILGGSFRTIYVNIAKKEVEKIKMQNLGASPEMLVKICERKGGTSILSIFMVPIFLAVFVVFFMLLSYMLEMLVEIILYR